MKFVYLFVAAFVFFITVDARSDEEIVPNERSEVCRKTLEDEFYIVQMYTHGVTINRMRQKANYAVNHGDVTPERFAKIIVLIDEAENAVHEDKLMDWLNGAWTKCMNVI